MHSGKTRLAKAAKDYKKMCRAGAGVLLLHYSSDPVHAGGAAQLVAHQATKPWLARGLLEPDWWIGLLALVQFLCNLSSCPYTCLS